MGLYPQEDATATDTCGPATLYLTVKEAAHYAGIGEGAMRTFVDSQDPPPLLVVGNRKYVERDGLARYLRQKQTWHYSRDGSRTAPPAASRSRR